MTDDTTQTWLLRLQALTVAERPALLREMSPGKIEMCLLRLVEREAKLEALLERSCEAMTETAEWLGSVGEGSNR